MKKKIRVSEAQMGFQRKEACYPMKRGLGEMGVSPCPTLGLPGSPVAAGDLLVTLPSLKCPIPIFEVPYGVVDLCGLEASGSPEVLLDCFFKSSFMYIPNLHRGR